MNHRMWRSAGACLFFLGAVIPFAGAETPPAIGLQGMVSTAHPIATEAGLAILKAEGNAFDAAVAIAATLNVVEPMNSGMGGYGTILVYDARKKQIRFLNCSDRIPRAVDSDMYRPPTPNYLANRIGAKSVCTPGNVAAWFAMYKEYGKLPWARLFTSAITVAEKGFPIDAGTAGAVQYAFSAFPAHARAFYGRGGMPLRAGENLVQRDLAGSLKLLRDQGPEAMYRGALAEAIDQAMREAEGFLSITDLNACTAEWFEPIAIDYRGFKVYTASPPSTAFPSLIRLGLLGQYDVTGLGHNSTGYLHRFAEVTKHAFWCRLRYAGSPEHNMPPLEKLLSKAYWSETVAAFDMNQASPFVPPSSFGDDGPNTTHFVVADRWGNIVSATQTLGNLFGSRIMPKGTGIWLNNSLAYCTFEPAGNPMDAHAGRYKLSGDCPTIITRDDKPWVAIGTPGGHTIGQTVPQMVVNLIDFDMDIQEAIAAPRVSFIEPDILGVEPGIDKGVRRALMGMGHNVREYRRLGKAHGLTIDRDAAGRILRFTGGADPRGGGVARGYATDLRPTGRPSDQ